MTGINGTHRTADTVERAGLPDIKKNSTPPSIFIPTLYFAEGLPYTIVMMMTGVFYKNLNATNEFIGLTSFLYLPWMLKFLWAPLVDMYSTRRQWILVSQAVLTVLTAALASSALLPEVLVFSLIAFALIALASATHDIAIDGYYMDALEERKQAFFVGVRNASYKVAWLIGSGALVFLAGKVGEIMGGGAEAVKAGWYLSFLNCAMLFGALLLFHYFVLPHVRQARLNPLALNPLKDESAQGSTLSADATGAARMLDITRRFIDVARTFFRQERITAICLYILIFRLGDALMLKMAQPFLLDDVEKGGLAISTASIGIIYGTVGLIFLLIGGIVGGIIVSRFGLKRTLLPTAIFQNVAILLYWALAVLKPSITWVAIANSIEQFAYGLGTAAYTVFLLSVVRPQYKAAHYAIATALMAAGLMIPGAVSGYLTTWLGYQNFFLLSFIVSIPGMITIFFLPLKEEKA